MNEILAVQGNGGKLEKIIVDNTLFSVQHHSVEDEEGKITKQSVDSLIRTLFYQNLLYDAPPIVPVLTREGKPALLILSYQNGLPSHARCEIWAKAPTFHAAIKHLSSHYQNKEGLLIVSPKAAIPLRNEDTPKKYQLVNPFPELERFNSKIYDASLPQVELRRFQGKRFGTVFGYPYAVTYYFQDKLMSYTPFANVAPKPSEKRYFQKCFFEITSAIHQGFLEQEDTTSLQSKIPMFQQLWRVNLHYLDYNPNKIEV